MHARGNNCGSKHATTYNFMSTYFRHAISWPRFRPKPSRRCSQGSCLNLLKFLVLVPGMAELVILLGNSRPWPKFILPTSIIRPNSSESFTLYSQPPQNPLLYTPNLDYTSQLIRTLYFILPTSIILPNSPESFTFDSPTRLYSPTLQNPSHLTPQLDFTPQLSRILYI
jgi:hypothetical protein